MLGTAIVLADKGGIEALTMRKLAQELGVEAMSLYHYVAKKDDILDGIVDMVVEEMDIPSAAGDWKQAVRECAISAHEVLLRHPWACNLILSSPTVRPGRLLWMEALLATLRKGGFSANLTHHAYHALDSHIMGFTLWAANFPDTEELADLGAAFLQNFPVDEYPYLAEHIEQHVDGSSKEEESEFTFGLNLILDGLERMRDNA